MSNIISNNAINPIILGSTLYGCGGGGNPILAKRLLSSIAAATWPQLKPLAALPNTGCILTAFTVGGLNRSALSSTRLRAGLDLIQSRLNQPVVGIMPVEIGPLSLALAIKTASLLKLPLIDADFVGGRSSPEVFLETITLFNLPRTPLYVGDSLGNQAILETSASAEAEETFLRQFTLLSNRPALVLGYPLTVNQLIGKVAEQTVSQTLTAGNLVDQGILIPNLKSIQGQVIYQGTVKSVNAINQSGFSSITYEVISSTSLPIKVIAKNENLIIYQNNQPLLTCPDLITFCTPKGQPLYNQEIKVGRKVLVLGIKAVPLWRSNAGLKLFNPKLFDFKFNPLLLIDNLKKN